MFLVGPVLIKRWLFGSGVMGREIRCSGIFCRHSGLFTVRLAVANARGRSALVHYPAADAPACLGRTSVKAKYGYPSRKIIPTDSRHSPHALFKSFGPLRRVAFFALFSAFQALKLLDS